MPACKPDSLPAFFGGQRERTLDRIRVCDVAEPDFDLGMRVNLHGTMGLLEACRAREICPQFVFASSVAVYGGEMSAVIEDGIAATPQTSHGAQNAMAELLVNEYSRKGLGDGRALRLPTIVVRPVKPNKAASAFASSILRAPLQARDVVCPVSEDTGVWVPRRVVAGDAVARRVYLEPDPFIKRIVYGWPVRFAPRRWVLAPTATSAKSSRPSSRMTSAASSRPLDGTPEGKPRGP